MGVGSTSAPNRSSAQVGLLLVLASAVGIAGAVYWMQAWKDGHKDNGTGRVRKKDKKKSNKQVVLEYNGGLTDIEDLVGKSIIPLTLEQMKRERVVPYTKDEKKSKVDELEGMGFPNFRAHLKSHGQTLKRAPTEVFQMNIGFYCNQACTHCHVDSSPKRKEMMSKEIADQCLKIIQNSPSINVVDLTGGAPELNSQFRYLVESISKLEGDRVIIDRCNLTVLLEPHQEDLAGFLAKHKVRIIASLPCYSEKNVAAQRGDQIFERSIRALRMLNEVGYGVDEDLQLHLVFNPTGLNLPPPSASLQGDYKRELKGKYGIVFNQLHCITNMPINRFYDYLKKENSLDKYMKVLVDNFNGSSCSSVMCRSYLSVDPYGEVFDCDFNQQLCLSLRSGLGVSVFDISCSDDLLSEGIVTRSHCYGCTAGSGSSCGATLS
uniref:Radical SAM core domain-containing protein n=1 Tax=Mucochytrium quahogii TaxID=96639 RepID=A0A7S2RTC5_9STRA|mmetsp:Transcript_6639/g.10450  ORF Transcript_6639/g.10450 Transcript_6639/m.10450 type:complete len:434 (-) Transcript_6639:42-1343(-)